MNFKLKCLGINESHTAFTVFDSRKANCGIVTVNTCDLVSFLQENWGGGIDWDGHTTLQRVNTANIEDRQLLRQLPEETTITVSPLPGHQGSLYIVWVGNRALSYAGKLFRALYKAVDVIQGEGK